MFARDSSINTPWGPVVTQMRQWWRRGEYAPVIRFYEEAEIPIFRMITAAALEGGDVMIVEPGCVLIGVGEARTQEPAARQLAAWFEEGGWEARVEPIPSRYVHIDVLVAILGEKLAAVCLDVVSASLARWLTDKGFDLIDVPAEDAFTLGVNAVSLGGDRVISAGAATRLNEELARPRDRGADAGPRDVHARRGRRPLPRPGAEPGAPGWLSRPTRRRARRSTPTACSPTCASCSGAPATSSGAQRLCWSEGWREARAFLGELLAEIGLEPEIDEAGNLWSYLEGEREPAAGARIAHRLGPRRRLARRRARRHGGGRRAAGVGAERQSARRGRSPSPTSPTRRARASAAASSGARRSPGASTQQTWPA